MQQNLLSEIQLSDREREILQFISNGLSSAEIAERLFVSENTVEYHHKKLFQKLEVHNAAHLAGRAYKMKLISTDKEP